MTSKVTFMNPETGNLGKHIESSAARGLPFAQKDRYADERGVVLAGLGASLETPSVLREVRNRVRRGWKVCAIKEAITFLASKGIATDFSAAMDPTEKELGRFPVVEGVDYYLASSCHPRLYDELLDQGASVVVYHSACGYGEFQTQPGITMDLGPNTKQIAVYLGQFELATSDGYLFSPVALSRVDETEVYRRLFDCGDTMCGGYTVGNRALALMKYLGFPRVTLAGLDFGWRTGGQHYAKFCETAPLDDVKMSDEGKVDGKEWSTRPDLLASAVDVAWKIKDKSSGVEALGDSLAASLAKRDDAYLERIILPS